MSIGDDGTVNANDDLSAAERKAAASRHSDNKWEARAEAAAAGEPMAEPVEETSEVADDAPLDEPAEEVPAEDVPVESRARAAMAAKKARDAGDPTQPPTTLVVAVSILSYVTGVVAGWAVGSWLDGDPWPIAFAGVIGGVLGFLLGRALLRGSYALRA